MANSTQPATKRLADRDDLRGERSADPEDLFYKFVLIRLASLKITVTVFVMAVFLVVVGTLAQVDKDVWQVVDEYFRSLLVWIDLKVFFPPSFFPGLSVPDQVTLPGGFVVPLGFYFPGGWLIGGVMAINMLAAHSIRFTVQASGARLRAGWALVGLGCLMVWLVVAGGSNPDVEKSAISFPPDLGWRLLQAILALFCLVQIFACVRVPRGRSLERGLLLVSAAIFGGALVWTLRGGEATRLGDSSLRILWQMSKGQLAALVLLVGCAMLFRKRAGIVLIHGGIGLMMLGEVLTGLTAVEAHLQMFEGESANYVRHLRSLELAVIDHSNPERDIVVAVPESRLLSGKRVSHENLPFDLKLAHYLPNSTVRPIQSGDQNVATAGLGLNWVAEPRRPVSGTEGGKTNTPAEYVTLLRRGSSEELGTYLMTLSLSEVGLTETIDAGGRSYEVSLRHKRTYKPYTMKLIDVTKEDYPGTDIPRHYASVVQLIDDSRHVDRTVKIWMNNPLRYAGETFYQSGYYKDPASGAEASTLAVVANSSWMIPYVSCMLVATGLLAHFGSVLTRFLKRRSVEIAPVQQRTPGRSPERAVSASAGRPPLLLRLLPLLVVLVSGVWLISKALPPSTPSGQFKLYEVGKLPLIDHGRAKPLDTLARNSLQALSGKQTFVDPQGARQPAIRWLLDLVTRPDLATQYKVFRIENPEVLNTLGLESREGLRYAFQEFAGHLNDMKKQVELALSLDPSELSTYQKKILELERKLAVWDMLIQAYVPTEERLRSQGSVPVASRTSAGQPLPLSIPSGPTGQGWQAYAQARSRYLAPNASADTVPARATQTLAAILGAYTQGDVPTFNREINGFREVLRGNPDMGLDSGKVGFEAFYNHFEPCTLASALYVMAFVLAALAWLGWNQPLNRAAFALIVVASCVHTFALISRIYISGRPPVTNLYSSAIFIGWAAALFGIGLEMIYRMGIGNVIASVSGFATLLIAGFLGSDGDTMAVLQAVLDTQFWLATHVVCITLGYSATYVAGLLGVLYILRGVLTPSLRPDTARELSRMIYGTLCFAILFSFVGTVLGGLWADDSWGRFWGWDPKENGALIIVLWNALVLHARWGGLVKQRGLAVLAVAGNIAVSWSWFGVNELGIGLHSYGFTEGALRALGIFLATQLAIIAVGLLPESLWLSHRRVKLPKTVA